MQDDTAAFRERLITLIHERSFQSGREITLASGRTSTIYFNLKPTMMHPEGAYLIARLTLEAIAGDNAGFIGGLEMGAVPLAAAAAAVSHAEGRPVAGFFVRKQAKGHGTQSLIEGLAPGETLSGRRVVVMEDVTTTGGSALNAARALVADGAEVVRVITVVDREEGAAEAFAEAGMTFSPLLRARDFL